MNYSDSDIMRAVGANAFSAGKAYQRQGRFIAFQWDGDSGITAQVQGSDRRPYRQNISIETIHRGRVLIEGDCSCPVAFNCKHVAAGLLHGLVAKPSTTMGTSTDAPGTTDPAPLSLTSPVADWLNRLRQADARSQGDEDDRPQRLIYILSPEHGRASMPLLRLEIRSGRILKDGTMSPTSTAHSMDNWHTRSEAKFLRNTDRKILQVITSIPRSALPSYLTLFELDVGVYKSGLHISGVLGPQAESISPSAAV
jgi:hypothetical protein